MLTELKSDSLQEFVNTNSTVIVQYAASWCGNCRLMKPQFKRLANENENVQFVIVDAEQYPESRKLAKVENLPTFATFSNGALVGQVQTSKPENLKAFLNETTSH